MWPANNSYLNLVDYAACMGSHTAASILRQLFETVEQLKQAMISNMKRDLQNETASPNPKRDLQIHKRILLKNHSYEFGDRVSN